ncbi:MAG: hypothetical protein WCP29_13665 [Acidobacteriota bacterium]
MSSQQPEDLSVRAQDTETAKKPWVKPEMKEMDIPEMTEVSYAGEGKDFTLYSSTV